MVGLKQKSLVGLNHHDLYLRTEPISLGQLHGLHYRNDFTGHLSLAAQKTEGPNGENGDVLVDSFLSYSHV